MSDPFPRRPKETAMGIVAADLFLTLDGVYQAPGGRDEDRSAGFAFGGWQAPYTDDAIGASIMSSIERTDALLLGRRTYDIFAAYWPFQPAHEPVAAKFAAIPKYVVSRTLSDPSWAGTTVLKDAAAVGRLRDEFDEVHTWGSGDLLRTLLAKGLVDRLNLWMYPIALGTGKRLFDSGTVPLAFRPAQPADVFDSGVMALVLEPAGDVKTGEVAAAEP
ncbi:MAG: dihydrofolate reductase family protein [Chloroflexota bacterium]|nr:dihydrofolate reductase family protein [Chloroflexota bacterium]